MLLPHALPILLRLHALMVDVCTVLILKNVLFLWNAASLTINVRQPCVQCLQVLAQHQARLALALPKTLALKHTAHGSLLSPSVKITLITAQWPTAQINPLTASTPQLPQLLAHQTLQLMHARVYLRQTALLKPIKICVPLPLDQKLIARMMFRVAVPSQLMIFVMLKPLAAGLKITHVLHQQIQVLHQMLRRSSAQWLHFWLHFFCEQIL